MYSPRASDRSSGNDLFIRGSSFRGVSSTPGLTRGGARGCLMQASREPSVQILERPGDSSPRPVHRIPKPAHLGAQIEFHLQQSLRQARAPSTTLSQVIDPCKEPRVEAF